MKSLIGITNEVDYQMAKCMEVYIRKKKREVGGEKIIEETSGGATEEGSLSQNGLTC